MRTTKEHIIVAARAAGIVGAGGGGFPTYFKLNSKAEIVIVNGSECEPLLCSDRSMMVNHAEKLVEGVEYAMQATGAKRAIIALKEHYEDAVSALRKVLPSDQSITLHLLDNYYPAGDEFLLVYEVTGRVVPEGGIPLAVGVVVNNAITLMQLADAVSGQPVVERAVTLAGEFNEPKVVIVPIGTLYSDLIEMAGGLKCKEDVVFIDGGPMMGKIVNDISQGIGKTTSGLLAFPADSFVVRGAQKTLAQMVALSKSACCQCFRCSDLCPRNLLGHDIYPHLTMRTIDYGISEPASAVTSAFLCSQCGVCELIACDVMRLSPRKIYAEYKKRLMARGVKNPHQRKDLSARSMFDDRKIPIPMLVKKIGISCYDVPIPFEGKKGKRKVSHVRVPIDRHIGAKAIPSVSLGQTVSRCDIIAKSKDSDALGSIYHAPISGKVVWIDEKVIEIRLM